MQGLGSEVLQETRKTVGECYFPMVPNEPNTKYTILMATSSSRPMFVDPKFPPSNESLWGSGVRRCFEQLEWLRPQELSTTSSLFRGSLDDPQPDVHSVKQGLLPDCYLVAAIAVLARHPSLLRQLFVAYEPEKGWFTVRLFLNGQWQEITTDTYLPCAHKQPAFAHHESQELYACFLEKACAKAHGSYAALIGGHVDEALMDLTEAAVEEVAGLARPDLGLQLAKYWQRGDLLACAQVNSVARDLPVRLNHTYVVSDVDSQPGQPGQVRLQLLDLSGADGAESTWGRTCWLSLGDFALCFNRLSICHAGRLLDAELQRRTFSVRVTHATSGGGYNFPTFCQNSMFRVIAREPVELVITLSQPDMRCMRATMMDMGQSLPYPQIGMTVLQQDVVPGVSTDVKWCTRNRRRILAQTPFASKRDTTLTVLLEPLPANLEYRVVPSYYFPGDVGMGQHFLGFAWSGSERSVTVEELSPKVGTDLMFRQLNSDTLASGLASPFFRVSSKSVPVPLTIVLVHQESMAWWQEDSLYSSLHRLFTSFDADHDDYLSHSELDCLLAALPIQLDKGERSALLARCDPGSIGRISFGQFVSQHRFLARGRSKEELQAIAESVVGVGAACPNSGEKTYAAVAPLSSPHLSEPSLAAGCQLPLMSDASVWSGSFLVEQPECYLCPLLRGAPCTFKLQVQSPLDILVERIDGDVAKVQCVKRQYLARPQRTASLAILLGSQLASQEI